MKSLVSKYNNDASIESIKALLKKDKTVIYLTDGRFSVALNIRDGMEAMMVFKGGGLHILENVSLTFGKQQVTFKKGELLSPFALFCYSQHKGDVISAYGWLGIQSGQKVPFIRVGTDYYKLLFNSRTKVYILKIWKKQAITDDFGSDYINKVPRFDAFGFFPSNTNFKQVIDKKYNVYQEVKHNPLAFDLDGDLSEIRHTIGMIKHLFGDTWELGLEYLQVMWLFPMQFLPILVFASEEQNTGKSTMNRYLKMLFNRNHVEVDTTEMKSGFNSSIATKLCVCIEETKSENLQLVEKLKMLSTTMTMIVNEKFVPQYEVDFYAKFIIMTNHPEKFLILSKEETRFWVNIVPSLNGDVDNDIYSKLEAEIPNFLYYLENLTVKGARDGARMWFNYSEYETEALNVVKKESASSVIKEILVILDEYGEENNDEEFICFNGSFIYTQHLQKNSRITRNFIIHELTKHELFESKNGRYLRMRSIYGDDTRDKNGKHFSFKNPHFSGKVQEQESEEIPF